MRITSRQGRRCCTTIRCLCGRTIFPGASILGYGQVWDAPTLVGIGVTAGGGAYLIGSLANLPYALATAEEDFIAPENVQALIWQAAGPALLVDAIQPRWWDVSAAELHAAALYQRMGEELLMDATGNAELRGRVTEVLSERDDAAAPGVDRAGAAASRRCGRVHAADYAGGEVLSGGGISQAVSGASSDVGSSEQGAGRLVRINPSETSVARLSKDFGVPHPVLEQTNALAILNVKPLPAFSGEDYGLVGESWESSNLYWARLADEMGYPPVSLNLLIPELSRHMIAKIFATDIEDWPAILRAMEQTGDEFRRGGIHVAAASTIAQH